MGLGLSQSSDTPIGSFGFVHGPALAASDRWRYRCERQIQPHGLPRTAIDLLVAGAMLVAQFR